MADEVLLGRRRDHQEWLGACHTAASIPPWPWMPVAESAGDRPWDAAIAIAVYRIGLRRLDAAFDDRICRSDARDVGWAKSVIVPAVSSRHPR